MPAGNSVETDSAALVGYTGRAWRRNVAVVFRTSFRRRIAEVRVSELDSHIRIDVRLVTATGNQVQFLDSRLERTVVELAHPLGLRRVVNATGASVKRRRGGFLAVVRTLAQGRKE